MDSFLPELWSVRVKSGESYFVIFGRTLHGRCIEIVLRPLYYAPGKTLNPKISEEQ